MKKVLFQGDSITDWYRDRGRDDILGSNYPTMVAGEIGLKYPGEYEFVNRGVSGDRSIDVLARVRRDIIALKPDIMSMLIGVNDVWHRLEWDNGTTPERYEKYYNMIIEEVKESLPDIKLMILEPFILNGTVAEKDPDGYIGGVHTLAGIAKRVAEENGAVFIPLQGKFDEMLKYAPAEYWSYDGVHPTASGHCIIKNAWIEAFEKHIR